MPTLSCTEFERQLTETVERRGSADREALRQHACACAKCRALWLDALLVDRAVAGWKKPVPAAGLTDRILSHVAAASAAEEAGAHDAAPLVSATRGGHRAGVPPGRRVTRVAASALTGLAVCLIAVLVVGRALRPAPVEQMQIAAVQNHVSNPSAPAVMDPAPGANAPQPRPAIAAAPVELMVADAGSAYLHLAGKAARAVTAASVLVPTADVARETSPAPKHEDRWVEGVEREIAPVTHQLSHAFNFLIQAVPEKRAPAT
jgi:hypothetical protein